MYLDDYLFVEQSPFYANPASLMTAFLRPVWTNGTYYRPVSTVFYVLAGWVSSRVSGQVSAWAFHGVNVILLAAFALALVAFLRKAFELSREAAILATLLFLLHPAMTGTVAWVCGQNELLLGIWALSAMIALALALPREGPERRKAGWLAAHAGFVWLALLTKENAIALPALGALYVLAARARRPLGDWAALALAWAAALAAWHAMLKLGAHQSLPVNWADARESGLNGLPALLIYLGRLALPLAPLSVLPTIADTGLAIWLAGALGSLALFAALVLLKERRLKLSLFGLAWFLAFLVPTFYRAGAANDDPLTAYANIVYREDRAFVAAAGLLVVLLQLPLRLEWKRATALALVLATLGLRHELAYRDGMSFYRSAAATSPGLAFAHAHLGDMEIAAHDYPQAIAEYTEAIRLHGNETNAHNNLGVVYLRQGDLDRAQTEFLIELGQDPKSVLSLTNLGYVLLARGQYPAAEKALTQATAVDPSYSFAWEGLVKLYTLTKDSQRLLAAQKALEQRGEWSRGSGI